MSPFWILLELRMIELVVVTCNQSNRHPPTNQHLIFLQAKCPSNGPPNSNVRALKYVLNRNLDHYHTQSIAPHKCNVPRSLSTCMTILHYS